MLVSAGAAVVLALVTVACGGVAPRARSTSALGFADATTTRGMLARYAPSGHAIVTAYEALPSRFVLPEGPYEVSSHDTFDGYLRDRPLEMLVTFTSTAVHEITHGYASRMGYQLLAARALPRGDGALAILGDGEPWLVRLTPTFPSSEMDASFPADARTFRYTVYIAPSQPDGGTQQHGIFGLLDEFTASYQDARVTMDFWPYVRDEAPDDWRVIMNYAVGLEDLQRAYAEFTLFILHYLRHAREHRPDVHAALLGNGDFRSALLEVHDAYAALAASARELEPTVYALARIRGVELAHHNGQLVIDGNPQRQNEVAATRAVFAHLDDEAYRAELAALR